MLSRRDSLVVAGPAEDRRGAFTLIELLVSVFASSMLMVGLGSAIMIATKAVSPPGAQQSILDIAETSHLLADEIQSAVHVLQQTPTVVEFACADRNDDGSPDRIRYAWNDQTGQVVRTEASSGSLLDDVDSFNITPDLRGVPETLNGIVSESSASTLESMTSGGQIFSWNLGPNSPVGQYVSIDHPDDTALWSITKVKVRLRRHNPTRVQPGEKLMIQIRLATGDGLPTSTVLAESSINVSSLNSYFRWKSFTMSGAERLLKSQSVCLVIMVDDQSNGTAGRAAYKTSGFSDDGHLLGTTYFDYDWEIYPNACLNYRVIGTRHSVDSSSHEVVREYIAGYNVDITTPACDRTVSRKIRLMNTPEQLDGIWRLDFNSVPTDAIDADYDGADDWAHVGNSDTLPPPSNSVIPIPDGHHYQTTVDNDFAGLITAEVHCQGTSVNASGGGAVCKIPFGYGDSTHGLVTITCDKTVSGRQTASVVASAGGADQILAMVNNLPDAMVEFRVVVDPENNQAAVWINDIFQGRSVVTQTQTTGDKRMIFGAQDASVEFDYLSVRVGKVQE
ncbi:MAG: prepilin-type N-terminal cleavage/methylation domain-containing protein [Fuerstiella sp.]